MRSEQELEAKLESCESRLEQARLVYKNAKKSGQADGQDIELMGMQVTQLSHMVWALRWVLGKAVQEL